MEEVVRVFAEECRDILKSNAGPAGLEQVRRLLERRLLSNALVIEAYLSGKNDPERNVLYEDTELGFCIVAHRYPGPRQGRIHDHGPAWAIYGQVSGSIDMTEYDMVEPARDGRPAYVKPARSYKLEAGSAVVYPQGQVHSPNFPETVRVIRIEGRNLDGVPRERYDLA